MNLLVFHHYYSHLATYISASLCAVLPNVRIMEVDIDDVPWKDDLTTHVPEIVDGYMKTELVVLGLSKIAINIDLD